MKKVSTGKDKAKTSDTKQSQVNNDHPTILLIEDEPLIVELYKSAFAHTPYNFLVATNKEEAIETLFKYKPTLVLLDLIIPMSGDLIIEYEHPVGFDILELIKKSDVTHDSHVFVLTNVDTKDYQAHAKKLGADRVYIKTETSPRYLVDEVTKFLK